MEIDLITLFPQMFQALDVGITGRAQRQGLLKLRYWNPREFTTDGKVDDRPYGGSPGMLMQIAPLQQAIQAAKAHQNSTARVLYLSPKGRSFEQKSAEELARAPSLILVSGRYEGIDERLLKLEIDEEWSIGDFILTGGELAAMCLIDAITRLLPGALGNDLSAQEDSFKNYLLDAPHYTRPPLFAGLKVPSILLTGHHTAIKRWCLKQSLANTYLKRPDLLKKHSFSPEEALLLAEFFSEYFSGEPHA